MKTILAELNETISARGSIVVCRDGMLIASDVREGVDVERLAALGAAIVTEIGQSPAGRRTRRRSPRSRSRPSRAR